MHQSPSSRARTPPNVLPPLASAVFVCRNARPAVDASVTLIVSDFIDYARSGYWRIPQACEKNDLRLLQRLAARESPSISQHYKAYLARCSLRHAVKHENMEMIRWLHVYCPATHVLEAMKEAASLWDLRVMTWIADNYEEIQWGTSYGETAAQNQDLKVLEWIKARRPEFLSTAMRTAASCGHFENVKWLHANAQNEDYGIEEAVESVN